MIFQIIKDAIMAHLDLVIIGAYFIAAGFTFAHVLSDKYIKEEKARDREFLIKHGPLAMKHFFKR